ncbi:hypothetical protein NPX13_g1892 [Xylaria arbuscula]|uniref:Cyanovirin-N domain-containing protein n=1 Tax=Xylaria arbuscula TaxID=114810 RepID=A0A9W8NLS3_9PEZI|nr:hypothetical protein NPX13_g1892 [Xylaria arbuscula]
MRAATISALLPLLSFSVATPIVVPCTYRQALSQGCINVKITDDLILEADCKSTSNYPGDHPRKHASIDLNGCFANYKGTLNAAQPGGFGASCSNCSLDDKYTLHCDCATGSGTQTMKTSYDLSYWRTVHVFYADGSDDPVMGCAGDAGIDEYCY